ncbi:MAG: septum formation initiator family protein [Desulfovibrio sp.]|nr:septum formation initiator family protein [Desulfovibrio sp.]
MNPVLSKVLLFLILGIFNASLFYFMIWGPNGLLAFQELKKQQAELEAQKEELDDKCLMMSHAIRLLKTDKDYQEKMIRQKLRYIRDNEFVYIFDDAMKK